MQYQYDKENCRNPAKSTFEIPEWYFQPGPNREAISSHGRFYMDKNKITYFNEISTINGTVDWKRLTTEVLIDVYGSTFKIISQLTIGRMLIGCCDGKLVLTAYRDRGFLDKNVRNLLSRLVIRAEKDIATRNIVIEGQPQQLDEFKISKARFTELAAEIHRINGSGCLLDHYKYTKAVLRKRGLLVSQSILRSMPSNIVLTELKKINLDWLRNHLDDDARITLQYWKSTFNARRNILRTGETIQDYYQAFPCLRTALGAELLLSDFNQIHPDKENILFERFECIRKHLIKRLKNCTTIKSIEDKAYVHLLESLLIRSSPYRAFASIAEGRAAYVAFDDVLYKVDSSLHAVNLCFGLYFALEAAYPERSASSSYIRHIKYSHHPEHGYKCSVSSCSRVFTSFDSLRKHITVKHERKLCKCHRQLSCDNSTCSGINISFQSDNTLDNENVKLHSSMAVHEVSKSISIEKNFNETNEDLLQIQMDVGKVVQNDPPKAKHL
ncbi:hypothetical protein PV328_007619 [Microctonus aethiopoides]|uniref:C2H2-type domain-containing protein n=1 Tax=Microctonus aethiopoides TaxID=144406 RepID=A0AA39C961_9HYME|nr:hypothetical protein PV328_007619 [Microctonus aethiopoides]